MASNEQIEKRQRLEDALMNAVLESRLTYCEVLKALAIVRDVIREKGCNLLDGANIQEVAEMRSGIIYGYRSPDIRNGDHQ